MNVYNFLFMITCLGTAWVNRKHSFKYNILMAICLMLIYHIGYISIENAFNNIEPTTIFTPALIKQIKDIILDQTLGDIVPLVIGFLIILIPSLIREIDNY